MTSPTEPRPITESIEERLVFVAGQYGIENPDHPLAEWGMDRFTARNLVEFALDNVGVPKKDDHGDTLTLIFRCRWLLWACEEAEDA